MTDEHLDPDTAQGQAALIAQAGHAIDNIGATAATSPDQLVKVWVSVTGGIVDIDLDEGTRALDRNDLARLITATAQKAAQNAASRVYAALAELEQQRERLLQELHHLDPEAAAPLRDICTTTWPAPPKAGDPFGTYQPRHDADAADDW